MKSATTSKPPARKRPGPSFAARARSVYFALARNFTREKFIDFLKTIAWVIPLTLLIWIYAEREQIIQKQPITVHLSVSTQNPNLVIDVDSPADLNVVIEASGPRTSLDELLRRTAPTNNERGLEISLPASIRPGQRQTLDAVNLIRQNSIIRELGITVSAVNPPLTVTIDQLVEMTIPVQVPPGLSALDGAPVFTPAVVTVRGPKNMLDEIQRKGDLGVFADLASLPELRQPGTHNVKGVPLTRTESLRHERITISPLRIEASLKVKEADASYAVPGVVVNILKPPVAVMDEYRVVVDPTLDQVTVIGPPDVIEAMRRDPNMRPVAVLAITNSDLARVGESQEKRLQYIGLPPSVRLSDSDRNRTIKFTIERIGN